jgi:hypothetical protein
MVDRPATWRVSSYSGQGGSCVEVRGDLCAVRDSKHPDGPSLHIEQLRELVRVAKTLR